MTTFQDRLVPRALTRTIAAAIALTAASAATADVVTSEDILRIRFTVDNNFTPQPPDVMRLNFGLVDVLEAYTRRIAELYDGETLLGTASPSSFGNHVGLLNLDPSNSFKAPGSPWTFDMPGTADFTTILDGTIEGRIDWHPQTGSVDIPLNQINLNFVKATGGSSGIIVSPAPTITSIEIIGACPEDLDGSGAIDFGDILAVLAAWGNAGGPEDLDNSGFVDFGDLLAVLAAWGSC